MKKSKFTIYYIICLITIFFFFNLLLFLLTLMGNKSNIINYPGYWMSYAFVFIGFIILALVRLLYNSNNKSLSLFTVLCVPLGVVLILLNVSVFFFVKEYIFVWQLVIDIVILLFEALGFIISIAFQGSIDESR